MTKSAMMVINKLSIPIKINGKSYLCVKNFDLVIHRGETTALIGESGSGKTVTAQSIMRLLPSPPFFQSTGEILYHGDNLLSLPEYKMRELRGNKITIIFQDPTSALNPLFRIGDQLTEAVCTHLQISEEEARLRALFCLKESGLTDPESIYHLYPHQLSGGMRQRVMIAMALMCTPDLLIADEPTTALDVTIQAQLLKVFQKLQKEKGLSILLITHNIGIVAEIAQHVVVVYLGEKIEEGSCESILNSPSHPYTKALFNSELTAEKRKKKLNCIQGNVPSIQETPTGCSFHPRCPYAMEKCRHGEVPTFSVDSTKPNETPHTVKCWLYET